MAGLFVLQRSVTGCLLIIQYSELSWHSIASPLKTAPSTIRGNVFVRANSLATQRFS